MSTEARPAPPVPGSRWWWLLPIAAAGAAAGITAQAASVDVIPFVAAVALGVTAVLVVRAAPLPSLMVLLAIRTSSNVLGGGSVLGGRKPTAGELTLASFSLGDALGVLFVAGAVWWLYGKMREGVQLWRIPLVVPVFTLVGLALISLVYTPGPTLALKDLGKFSIGIAAYLVIAVSRPGRRELKILLAVVLAGAVFPLLIGLLQFVRGVGVGGAAHGGLRVSSIFGHPNSYGFYLVAIMAAAWGLRREVQPPFRWIVNLIGLGAFGELALTGSRSAWGAGAILVVVLGWKRKGVLAIAALGAVIITLLMPRVLDRALDFFREPAPGTETSLTIRLDTYALAIEQWQQKPLFGGGWGSFSSEGRTGEGQIVRAGTTAVEQTHNDFLRALVELGIIGFAAFLFLIGSLLVNAYRWTKGRVDYPLAFFCLAISWIIVAATTENLRKPIGPIYFWALAGIAYMWTQVFPARAGETGVAAAPSAGGRADTAGP